MTASHLFERVWTLYAELVYDIVYRMYNLVFIGLTYVYPSFRLFSSHPSVVIHVFAPCLHATSRNARSLGHIAPSQTQNHAPHRRYLRSSVRVHSCIRTSPTCRAVIFHTPNLRTATQGHFCEFAFFVTLTRVLKRRHQGRELFNAHPRSLLAPNLSFFGHGEL